MKSEITTFTLFSKIQDFTTSVQIIILGAPVVRFQFFFDQIPSTLNPLQRQINFIQK